MRTTALVAAVAAGLFAAGQAHAGTCADAVNECVKKGGGVQACYAPLPECKRTCKYVAPSGKVWPASGDCGGKSTKK